MIRPLAALAFALTLAACGGDSSAAKDPFAGRFTTSFQGSPVTLVLERSGDALTMTFAGGGQQQTIQATIEGSTARGTFRDPQVQGEGRAVLEVQDQDRLKLTLIAKNAFGGEQSIPFEFTREAPAAGTGGGNAAAGSTERDPALIGVWRKTQAYSSGPDFGAVTDTFMTIRADGTFRHGDTNLAAGTGAVGATSRGSDAVEGQWKTQNRQLYARTNSQEPWQHVARYYIEGAKLLATLPNGEREVWTRVR
ncbi:MAG: hypothetical protein QNJ98_08090 [Planctomycetota bacterium]|nr:hypothetical protein [Planctomycetota bacterium]